jgi:hypothetical protein
MSLATVIRLEFAYPGIGILAGDSLQYLSIATAHGVIMVFFMIMPAIFGAFGNFLLPTQLGVHDVAFPRLNSAAFWFLPAGLIMLCQLICVDRRYQRMNCFNIRELQSLLKRKYFTDLVNSNDHRDLLSSTMVGLRYKMNSTNNIDPNIISFYSFGTTFMNKSKSDTFSSIYNNNMLLPHYDNFIYTYVQSVLINFYKVLNNLFIELILGNILLTPKNSQGLTFNTHYYNTVLASEDVLFGFVTLVQNFSVLSSVTVYNTIILFKDIATLNFNWDSLSLIVEYCSLFKNKYKNSVSVEYESSTIQSNSSILSNSNDISNLTRFTRFNNPVITYSYKSGNYLGI